MAAEPGRRTVLVVDDEPMNRDLMRRMLAPLFDVLEAEGVERALELLAGGAVDLVLSDQLMNGLCGTDLAAEVAQRWPRLPVLILTGLGADGEVDAAVARGEVRRVVRKPWTGAELRAAVREELEPAGKE